MNKNMMIVLLFISIILSTIDLTASQDITTSKKIIYIGKDYNNYDIIKQVTTKIGLQTDFIQPSRLQKVNLKIYDLVVIGPLAHQFWEGGLDKYLRKIYEAGKPLILIGEGPSTIPSEILGENYIKENLIPAYPFTANGFTPNKYLIVDVHSKLLSYPLKVNVKYALNYYYFRAYNISVPRNVVVCLKQGIKGHVIATFTHGYTPVVIYRGSKIFFALWGYDQLYGLTQDGENFLGNIIYFMINNPDFFQDYIFPSAKPRDEEEYSLLERYDEGYRIVGEGSWFRSTNSSVHALALSNNGYLISGDAYKGGGNIRVYDPQGKKLFHKKLKTPIWEADCDDDGRIFVAAGGNTVIVLERTAEDSFKEKEIHVNGTIGNGELSLGENATKLYIGVKKGKLLIYNISYLPNKLSVKKIAELKLGKYRVVVSASRYSNVCAVATAEGKIYVVNDRGKILYNSTFKGSIFDRPLSMSSYGKYIALGTSGGEIIVYNSKLEKIWAYNISQEFVSSINSGIGSVKISRNGGLVAVADLNGYGYVFDGSTGRLLTMIRTNLASQKASGLLGNWVVDVSDNGEYVIIGAAEGFGNAYLLANISGRWQYISYLNTWEAVRVVKFSPNGKYVAVGTVNPYATYRKYGLPSIEFYFTPSIYYSLSIKGVKIENLDLQGPIIIDKKTNVIWCKKGSFVSLSVKQYIKYYHNGTRLVFDGWVGDVVSSSRSVEVRVTGPLSLRASWRTQYYLDVWSKYGYVQGGGWYDESSTARICVLKTAVNLYGDHSNGVAVFSHWEGDIDSSSPCVNVLMDSPKRITAKWLIMRNITETITLTTTYTSTTTVIKTTTSTITSSTKHTTQQSYILYSAIILLAAAIVILIINAYFRRA